MRKQVLTVIACLLLVCAGTAQAKLSATVKCEQSKLMAQGVLESCLQQNSVNILGGKPDKSETCRAKFADALARADATAAKAQASCRYVDNGADASGDDTVSDLNTGLMWEKETGTAGKPSSGRVDDVNNRYDWSSTGDNLANGTVFTVFLAGLNTGASSDGQATTPIIGCFASHCDWRLPSIVELQGIIDLGAADCPGTPGARCIDPIFGPTQTLYWTATIDSTLSTPGAWLVGFDSAGIGGRDEEASWFARAVRGGL
jgi:hypothetical protein